MKSKIHDYLEKVTKKKAAKPTIVKRAKKEKSRLGVFFAKLMAYTKANTPVLKKARKKELIKAFKSIFEKEKKALKDGEVKQEEEIPKEKIPEVIKETKAEEKPKEKRDFTYIFAEADSFISWLLCFYIIYFFLVGFSIEKNIGLSREFIFKTLKTPLILNITILLLLIHFTLRVKNLHFRHNFFAAVFLIFLSLGVYALLVVNF